MKSSCTIGLISALWVLTTLPIPSGAQEPPLRWSAHETLRIGGLDGPNSDTPVERSGWIEVESDRFAGCYVVQVGEWNPPLLEEDEPYQTLPDTVRLSLEVGEGSPFEEGKRLVRPVIPTGRTPSAYWSQESNDSVHVVWTNGFSGVRLHLEAIKGGELSGVAEAFTDVMGRPVPKSEVVLQPTPCI